MRRAGPPPGRRKTMLKTLQITVCLMLTGCSHAAEVTLMNTFQDKGRAAFRNIMPKGYASKYMGWDEQTIAYTNPDKTEGTYQGVTICDAIDLSYKRDFNKSPAKNIFTISPVIEKVHDNSVFINIELKTTVMPNAMNKFVEVYYREVDSDDVFDVNDKPNFTAEEVEKMFTFKTRTCSSKKCIETTKHVAQKTYNKYVTNITIGPIKKQGVMLAFRDSGSCIQVGPIKVSYSYCEAVTKMLANFPLTMADPRKGKGGGNQVRGTCVNNTDRNQGQNSVFMSCNERGEWVSLQGSCTCDAGFAPIRDHSCKECGVDRYKSTISNDNCMSCPKNSNTGNKKGAHQCTCLENFYRIESEGPDVPCSSIPSAPKQLKIVAGTKHVLLTWERPEDIGGRFEPIQYRILCKIVETGADCPTFPIALLVEKSTSHRISNLSSSTNYEFTVISLNAVSRFHFEDLKSAIHSKSGVSRRTKTKKLQQATAIRITSSSATVTWSNSDENSRFNVSYNDFFTIVPRNQAMLQGLDQNTVYKVVVKPVIESDLNYFLAEVEFKTDKSKEIETVTQNYLSRIPLTQEQKDDAESNYNEKSDKETPTDSDSGSFTKTKVTKFVNRYYIAIILIILVFLVLILAFAVFCVIIKKKGRKSTHDKHHYDDYSPGNMTTQSFQTGQIVQNHPPNHPNPQLLALQQDSSYHHYNDSTFEGFCRPLEAQTFLKIQTENFPNNGVQYDSGLFQNQNNIRNNVHTNSTLLTHLDEKIQHAIITQNQHNNNNNSCTTASSLENIENNNGSRMNSPNRMKNYIDPAELMPFEQRIRKFVREIYPNALSDREELATGHFGVVYKAKLTKVEDGEKVVKDVAVKQCKNAEAELVQGAENFSQEFLREAAILGQLRHENIIGLEGVQYKIRPFLIVTEFMEKGSLETFVQTHATQIQDSTLIRLLSDVSNAMSYLNKHYIHRDLAARNILIGYKTQPSRQESGNSSGNSSNQSPSDQHSNKTLALSSEGLASESGEEILNERRLIAKVADFGLAIPCGENFTRMNPGHRSTPTKSSKNPGLTAPINQTEKMVPLRWTSPEALEFEVWSQKSDVWSFGILCFEVLSRGERPFWNLRDNEVINIVTDLTKRLHVSKILQKPVLINEMIYRQVICPCLESLPERRPDFEHVSYALNSIKDNLPSQSSSSISQHNTNLANSTRIIDFLPTDNYTSSSSLSAFLGSIGQIPKSVLYSLLRRNCVTFEQLQHDMLKLTDNPNSWTSFGVPDGNVAGLLKRAVCDERTMPQSNFCVEEYFFMTNHSQSQNTVNLSANLSQTSGQPQNNSQFRGQQPQQIRAASNEQIRRQFTCHNGMEVVEI